MKRRSLIVFMVLVVSVISFQSCEQDDDEHENETKISTYNSTESHMEGQNCMNCHESGGSGEGWFTAAGTVYDSSKNSTFPNATVKLFTGPNGTGDLKLTIEVDSYGNFYTTENIDFGDGLYTSVEGNAVTKHMNSSITSGKCNSCHGINTDPIWTE